MQDLHSHPYPAAPDFSTGKRLTWFSGRFAPLRTKFACHPYSGGRINRAIHGATFEMTASRSFVVPPPAGWQRNWIRREPKVRILHRIRKAG